MDKVRSWIRQELEKGEDPELLRRSLKAQGLDPGLVDKAESKEGYSFSPRIPWKPVLVAVLLITVAFIAYNQLTHEREEFPGERIESRFNLTAIKGSPETVSIETGFIAGIERALQVYGSYSLKSELPRDHCYSIYNDWDPNGYYLGIKEIDSPDMNCLGDTINDTGIRTPHFVSIEFEERGATCICEETEVSIETSETRNIDTGQAIINLRIRKK